MEMAEVTSRVDGDAANVEEISLRRAAAYELRRCW